jgi:hypothetical protein
MSFMVQEFSNFQIVRYCLISINLDFHFDSCIYLYYSQSFTFSSSISFLLLNFAESTNFPNFNEHFINLYPEAK